MLKKFIHTILLTSTLLLGTSCNKWLELAPQDGIIRQEFWKTKEDIQSAVVGIYSSMLTDPLVNNLFIWGELRADMVAPGFIIQFNESNLMTNEILSSNPLTSWRPIYKTINYCNTVIEFAPQVEDPTLTTEQRNAYLAEAHAVRGLMYFYLLRIWGEVPLKLTPTSSDATLEQLPKNTKEEVYNQIIADLTFAEANAVSTYEPNNPFSKQDKGRITKYTVNAIQADVYLWNEKYEDCLTACNKIIASGKYRLVPGTTQASWFGDLYLEGNSEEGIFELQFDNQKLNSFFPLFIDANRRFIAADKVLNDMYTIDFGDANNKDIRGDMGSVRASDGAIWKYVGWTGDDARTLNQSYAHWIVYRYADILLMKAEALAWTNRGQEALDIVNTIRTRAHALVTSSQDPDPTSALDVSNYILAERAREFAFEGKRWFDILRHAKRENYKNLSILLDMVVESAPADRQQTILNKFRDFNSHYLPINDYELNTDKNLVQNPFYIK
ncbi:RagB/SusD family nutrient uptake outer membrane protein [Pedobacter sp. SYSU D00535]|uniref:RagB/SusD family nutrient uptake outer membrane protein n=1 Tax=Pedobacter sp. SYSU D00535 TaxID=2810308 RepID=UPI001A95FD37|nr:RagB/SusD family nutrient uptake outer membrane protein [Pedobacter sp. SYSU D00535]